MEIMADIRTPIEVLKILKSVSGHCFLLESVLDSEKWGRYSFLGFEPKMKITCTDGCVRIEGPRSDELGIEEQPVCREVVTAEPAKYIREILDEHR
ncbi:MAG TPA: anthranilate synthase component I, partial [Clostridiales bacterium]|nr:anthranilate synthase component I [Clostridiales bacterium]